MVGNPSRLVLRDAIMAVLKTQELAGLDLVSDGELGRFDASNHVLDGCVSVAFIGVGVRASCATWFA